MSNPSYLPGSWFAVVGPRAVVLLEDSVTPSRLQSVWDACNGDPSLDQLIEVVTGGRFVGAPFFGIGLVDGAGLRVVVRTGVTAVVGESIGAARSIVSGHANTWVEEILDEPQSLRLYRDAAPSQVPELPVTGGIVLADAVTWTPSALLIPATPAASASRLSPVSPAEPPVVLVPGTPVVPATDDPADSEWSVWALDAAGELAGSGASGEPREQSEPAAHLESVPVQPRNELPPLLPEAQPESAFESATMAMASVPADPALATGEVDGVLPSAGASLGCLHFSTGEVVPLDRSVIVGRAPSADRVQRADLPRPFRIDNVDHDISRNHVEVRLDGQHVLVVDLDSANGTMLTVPGQVPQRLVPQEPVPLVPGAVVGLSEEIFFSYQPPQ